MSIVPWPPPTPPNGRTNSTPIVDAHPSDHNRIADALDTIVATIGRGPILGLQVGTIAANLSLVTAPVTIGTVSIVVPTAGRVIFLHGFTRTQKLGTGGTNTVFWYDVEGARTIGQGSAFSMALSESAMHSVVWPVTDLPAGNRSFQLRANGADAAPGQITAGWQWFGMATDLGTRT